MDRKWHSQDISQDISVLHYSYKSSSSPDRRMPSFNLRSAKKSLHEGSENGGVGGGGGTHLSHPAYLCINAGRTR